MSHRPPGQQRLSCPVWEYVSGGLTAALLIISRVTGVIFVLRCFRGLRTTSVTRQPLCRTTAWNESEIAVFWFAEERVGVMEVTPDHSLIFLSQVWIYQLQQFLMTIFSNPGKLESVVAFGEWYEIFTFQMIAHEQHFGY